ncbi:hypothetical protein C3747_116g5 [Trypanosoma cruzi]|uniref:Uncharacterized protein n=2 Tax=Trypanosoma cruzi TaxID=5693 RepID=Q4D2B7_TRYCC|nr:hypothetical protein, conserved [Trypanosoma cruzi]EAN86665.1 hypothetical protein, conserved [Trypanosoma cruzi]PWV06294.1 hypothetical protein C3747_116g5 [Trypanosoma cruzi]RNC59400.1 hypothetical protein TcCL_ESM02977 [Trypanosoma cruzi]|eukprot:XP_808516.1 hypothetical protein [Trypanosoma cruzi strain CL Brener]
MRNWQQPMRSVLEKTDEVSDVPDGKNIKYILRGTRILRLIVNLASEGDRHGVARARGAHIEDLPVTLDLKVLSFAMTTEERFLETAEALKELTDAGLNTKWAVDEKLLILVIDLSEGPKMSGEHAPGQSFVLASIRANSQLGKSGFHVSMKLHSIGGKIWPSLPSPRAASEATEDASPAVNVARMLDYSLSVSPPRMMMDIHGMHSELIRLDEFITLDVSKAPLVRLRLNLEGKDGQLLCFTGDILSGIGISLKVQVYKKTDSPPALRHPGKMENIHVYKEELPTGEDFLVVEFDSSKGNLDLSGKPRRNISNATRLCVNRRYVVDFTATGPIDMLPTFMEVYQSVVNYLGMTRNPLLTLNMPAVRDAVGREFPRCKMSRELKNLVWEAVRLYIVRNYVPHELYEVSKSPVALRVD